MTTKSLKSFLEVPIFFTDGKEYFRDESEKGGRRF
jgi:hypothetical protein